MGLVLAVNSYSRTDAGLIFSGLDTLNIPREKGFDFVTQTACTSYFVNTCILHFDMQYYSPSLKYMIFVQNGYSINKGKMNLDSIKTAPNDSLFIGSLEVDSIPPDSLSSRIGNVYVLKTGTDPRPFYDVPFYAKIKILKFIVLDSAKHDIKMVFLWAYNRSGDPDLHTSGLDTFHLDSTPISRNASNRPHAGQAATALVFKVATGKFTVPVALQGSNAFLGVYDLAGKKIGRVAVGNNRVIDMRQFWAGRGVVVVRVER
jgi:hypothetical protein